MRLELIDEELYEKGEVSAYIGRVYGAWHVALRSPVVTPTAANPISGSHWNAGFGSDPVPSRGDPCRRGIRPLETFPTVRRQDRPGHRPRLNLWRSSDWPELTLAVALRGWSYEQAVCTKLQT